MIRMKISCGKAQDEVTFYDEEVITVGRSSKNNLQIPDNKASRKHFLIEKGDNDSYRIVDLGSRNGTFVNGSKIDAHVLQKGDKINTGEATLTVIELTSVHSAGNTTAQAANTEAKKAKRPASYRRGAGGINVRRGPREMPMGLFDYVLVGVILVLICYIAAIIIFAVKNRTDGSVPITSDVIQRINE